MLKLCLWGHSILIITKADSKVLMQNIRVENIQYYYQSDYQQHYYYYTKPFWVIKLPCKQVYNASVIKVLTPGLCLLLSCYIIHQ